MTVPFFCSVLFSGPDNNGYLNLNGERDGSDSSAIIVIGMHAKGNEEWTRLLAALAGMDTVFHWTLPWKKKKKWRLVLRMCMQIWWKNIKDVPFGISPTTTDRKICHVCTPNSLNFSKSGQKQTPTTSFCHPIWSSASSCKQLTKGGEEERENNKRKMNLGKESARDGTSEREERDWKLVGCTIDRSMWHHNVSANRLCTGSYNEWGLSKEWNPPIWLQQTAARAPKYLIGKKIMWSWQKSERVRCLTVKLCDHSMLQFGNKGCSILEVAVTCSCPVEGVGCCCAQQKKKKKKGNERNGNQRYNSPTTVFGIQLKEK